jgi:hypothetical protein
MPTGTGGSNEFDLEGPSADGRLVRRMNSASRGLRPTVGLRRPRGAFCVGGGRRLARKRLGRPISIGTKAFGQRSAYADRKILFASAKADARRASASEGRFQSARRPPASGRLYASNEFDLEGPLANSRPAPTEKYSSRRRRPTPGAQAPQKADFNRRKAFGQRSACAPNEFGLQRPLAASAKAASAPQKAISDRNEFGLQRRPTVPAPTAKADARRVAPQKADFNRRKAFGQRSACGDRKILSASAKADARRVAP